MHKLLVAAAGAAFWLQAGTAGAADLTIGLNVTPTSMDPHYHQVGQNFHPLSHVFEPLMFMDGDRETRPALAESMKPTSDLTWEIRLRKGVKFHDGSDFTAEDVMFSLKRVALVPNSPSSYAIYAKAIESMTAPDPHTLVVKTSVPAAELPVELAQILIMSHKAGGGPAAEGKTTQQLNAGDGMVGTGPYTFKSFVPNDRMVVSRNPNYWGTKAPWDNVTLRVITSDPSRAAAVLTGEIDVTGLPAESQDALKGKDDVRWIEGNNCFFTYLSFDQNPATMPGVTDSGGKNPLADRRVRKALSLAINREAIAERTLGGLGAASAELGYGLFGANPDITLDPFDPDQARKLLAEAGFPNGFGLTIATPRGLFPNDSQIAQAIASMWTRVGVRTNVDAMVGSLFYGRRNKLEFSSYVTRACPYNGQMSYSLRILAMTRDLPKGNGQINVSTYSNPKVDELLNQAFRTVDDAARAKLVQQAGWIVMKEDYAVLAIVRHRSAYAARKHVALRTRPDGALTAMQITPQ